MANTIKGISDKCLQDLSTHRAIDFSPFLPQMTTTNIFGNHGTEYVELPEEKEIKWLNPKQHH